MASTRIRVEEVQMFERPVRLRLPFRFGVVTLTEAPQVFVRVRIAHEGGSEAWGSAAELLAPKWFDKNRELSNQRNFEQLRESLTIAAGLYRSAGTFLTPFGLHEAQYVPQIEACAGRELNRLIAGFGQALLDRAVLDAFCRALEVSFYRAIQDNLPGIGPSALFKDLQGFDFDGFLADLLPRRSIHARHTIGLADPISRDDKDEASRPRDGLPESLDEVVEKYRHTYFKIKVSGDKAADLERLRTIAATLDGLSPHYMATLDGNEQYEDIDGLNQLLSALAADPRLRNLHGSLLLIEQPFSRRVAMEIGLQGLKTALPVIIDESDADWDAFLAARQLGYRGVSSKACKGVYRSILNAARCSLWNRGREGARYFLSAEDLTTQPGPALQQDLALACLLGIQHVERNGHHYVNGMAALPEEEQDAFLRAHPDLYHREDGVVRLRILEGRLETRSLACSGYAVAAEPDWEAMRSLADDHPPKEAQQ